mmetsp:Transcript_3664/g.4083  ORF Transcript_3664/g.4083 Transcript_3664/m.4083 type:complete len:268 (-) Transcript_3664:122-925(-)
MHNVLGENLAPSVSLCSPGFNRIAFNLSKIPYTYVDALILQEDESYHKIPELLEHNPKGLVPTIVTEKNESKDSVIESLICVQYIDEVVQASTANGTETSSLKGVLPGLSNPALRADCRVKSDWINRELCSPFYTILVRQEEKEQKRAFQRLVVNLKAFSKAVQERNGLFYYGNEVSMVDIALFPWAYRYELLEHYRGPEYALPDKTDPDLKGYWTWYGHMLQVQSVKDTLQPINELKRVYARYARGDAKSKVGAAVRDGLQAHDIE